MEKNICHIKNIRNMNVIPWSKYQNENTSKIQRKINRKEQVESFGMVSNYS